VAWVPWITVMTYVAVNIVGLTLFRPAILSTLSRSGMPHSG
jgi:hypothetical protein